MATLTKNPTTKSEGACCKAVTCPTCGTTECIERPRYFSGQMLTDRDLDAAQRYVIDKNRLHNRYLVGTGTVCGLAVRCDRCDAGTVVVQPGYAIDCCGNDIVLCGTATFSVADWLHACRRKQDDCGKITSGPCDELPREYYLVLYYNEEPIRPVTALMRGDGCSNVRCEPSRIKESYRLTMVDKETYVRRVEPSMIRQMRECVTGVMEELKKVKGQITAIKQIQDPALQRVAALQLFCRWRDYVLKLYKLGVNNRCTLADDLRKLEDEATTGGNATGVNGISKALTRLLGYVVQYVLDCICDAILVPCSPCDDEGVVLACLTVENDRVTKICNTARTQIATGPAMRYWLQPIYAGVGKVIERVCCEFDLISLFDREDPKDPTTGQTTWKGATGFATVGTRGANMAMMSTDYAQATSDTFASAAMLMPMLSADLFNAADIYHMPLHDAEVELRDRKINYTVRQTASDSEAYSLGNIANMQWVLRSDRAVEILVSPSGHVTAVRSYDQKSYDQKETMR